MMRHVLLIFSW